MRSLLSVGLLDQTCVAATGTWSLVLFDDVTADRKSRIHSELYSAILFAQI